MDEGEESSSYFCGCIYSLDFLPSQPLHVYRLGVSSPARQVQCPDIRKLIVGNASRYIFLF